MTDLNEVALILGAVDGDIISASRRIVRILRAYQWATSELLSLVNSFGDGFCKKRAEEIKEFIRREVA